MLEDNTHCSIASKIHFAQESGATILLLSYVDDNIQEAEVDIATFSGVDMPVILIKKSDANYLYGMTEKNKLSYIKSRIMFRKDQLIADDANKLLVFMSSQPIRNPVIDFLGDLRRHEKLLGGKELEIIFAVGFCTSCKHKGYLEKAERCLSGGRYCAVNSFFKTEEIVKETLRQICIRNYYGNNKLIMYLGHMNVLTNIEVMSGLDLLDKDEAFLNRLSEMAMRETRININNIAECFSDSFIKRNTSETIHYGRLDEPDVDIYYDDNSLLQKEQERFLQIAKFNIFPLLIIDDVMYDKRINLRSFVDFTCKNNLMNCSGYKEIKSIFINSLVVVCIILLLIIGFICKKSIEGRSRRNMNTTFRRVIGKYYKLRADNHESSSLDNRSMQSGKGSYNLESDKASKTKVSNNMMDNSIVSEMSNQSIDQVEIPTK